MVRMGRGGDVSRNEHLGSGSRDVFVYLVSVYNCGTRSFTGARISQNTTVKEG